MIRLISFGYKYRKLPQADLLFDCRSISNPHRHLHFRPLTGKDRAVQEFVMADRKAVDMLARATADLAPGQTIAFGCFGGRHRSVSLVERLAAVALKAGLDVEISHTALGETRSLSPSSTSSSAYR
jgi:RNase adapter protein RapZ